MCDCVDWLVLRHRFLFYFPSFYPRNSLGYVSNEGKVHSSGLLIKGLFVVFFLISFKSQWSSSALSLSHGLISSIMAQCESTEWPIKCFNASRTCVQCLQPSSSVFRVESCEVFYVLKITLEEQEVCGTEGCNSFRIGSVREGSARAPHLLQSL